MLNMIMTKHQLKRRSDLHITRKVWHASGVLTIVLIFQNIDRSTSLQLMTFATSIFVVLDILRQQIPALNRSLIQVFHPVMRESERNGVAGTTYLLAGVFLVMAMFPPSIVTLALLFLAFADPIASYVGVLYGRDKILGSKSLQGSFAAFLCCTIIAAIYFFAHNLMTERLLVVSILAGIIGALAELIPLGKVDDNFTFPLISSIGLWGLYYLFGGF